MEGGNEAFSDFESFPVLFGDLAQNAARDQLEAIVSRLSVAEGVTDRLKAADQMEWLRRMNSIRARAEEIVIREMVYGE